MRKLIINLLFDNDERYLIKEALKESRYRKQSAMNETLNKDAIALFKLENKFDYKKDIYK